MAPLIQRLPQGGGELDEQQLMIRQGPPPGSPMAAQPMPPPGAGPNLPPIAALLPEPKTVQATGLTIGMITDLTLKVLYYTSNLAGHDIETLLTAFHAVQDDRPRCFLAYTIKGYRLPLAGHRDNHAGMLTPAQMKEFQRAMRVPEGREWDPFVGLDVAESELRAFLAGVPFARAEPRVHAADQ